MFYLGFVFNTGMNAVGMIDCLMNNFGEVKGSAAQIFPDGYVSINLLYHPSTFLDARGARGSS